MFKIFRIIYYWIFRTENPVLKSSSEDFFIYYKYKLSSDSVRKMQKYVLKGLDTHEFLGLNINIEFPKALIRTFHTSFFTTNKLDEFTNSKRDFVLKNRFEKFVLKISDKNKTKSESNIHYHLVPKQSRC